MSVRVFTTISNAQAAELRREASVSDDTLSETLRTWITEYLVLRPVKRPPSNSTTVVENKRPIGRPPASRNPHPWSDDDERDTGDDNTGE